MTERRGSEGQFKIYGEQSVRDITGDPNEGEIHARGVVAGMKLGTDSDEKRHPVIEIFGPTIQGEGPLIGAPCYFVRFGGCDYRCSWCDSKYAVIPEEVKANAEHLTDYEIARALGQLAGSGEWVILSGGNPALQHLDGLVDLLHERHYKVQVETQGTVWRPWLLKADRIVVSPKPPSSGMWPEDEAERGRVRERLDQFVDLSKRGTTAAKIVVFDEADFIWAKGCLNWLWDTRGIPGFLSVGNDYGKDSTEDLLEKYRWLCERTLADPTLGHVRVLPQMHVLIWGNARGV